MKHPEQGLLEPDDVERLKAELAEAYAAVWDLLPQVVSYSIDLLEVLQQMERDPNITRLSIQLARAKLDAVDNSINKHADTIRKAQGK